MRAAQSDPFLSLLTRAVTMPPLTPLTSTDCFRPNQWGACDTFTFIDTSHIVQHASHNAHRRRVQKRLTRNITANGVDGGRREEREGRGTSLLKAHAKNVMGSEGTNERAAHSSPCHKTPVGGRSVGPWGCFTCRCDSCLRNQPVKRSKGANSTIPTPNGCRR